MAWPVVCAQAIVAPWIDEDGSVLDVQWHDATTRLVVCSNGKLLPLRMCVSSSARVCVLCVWGYPIVAIDCYMTDSRDFFVTSHGGTVAVTAVSARQAAVFCLVPVHPTQSLR